MYKIRINILLIYILFELVAASGTSSKKFHSQNKQNGAAITPTTIRNPMDPVRTTAVNNRRVDIILRT